MRVLLIGPTALDYKGIPIKQSRLHLPGLTLPMLAAVTPSDVHLTLISETVEEIPFDKHWDLVGLTGMGSGIFRAWQIAEEFKRRKVTVVMGGIAASLCDPEWNLRHADCLVTGEAEEVWPLVIEDFRNGKLKSRYEMQHRPDIRTLPVPRYDLMNRKKLGLWRPVQATRGCPFPCSFCSIQSFFERTYPEIAHRSRLRGYENSELSWVVEDNSQMNKIILTTGAKVYKKYRLYIKSL